MPSSQGSAKARDYALTDDGKGGVILHRADCTYARAMAAIGRPVCTMSDCQGPMPKGIKRHSCLDGEDTL